MRIELGARARTLLLMAALGAGPLGCNGDPLVAARLDAGRSALDGGPGVLPDAAFDGGGGSLSDGAVVCTELGCVDEFVGYVVVDPTMVPGGRHTLGVTVDGGTSYCTFSLPPDPAVDDAPCSAGFTLTVAPTEYCLLLDPDPACQPPDQTFTETITVQGRPHTVNVQQEVGGTVIFDQTVSPTYQATQPNGPGCGPVCQQATATWTIPPQ